MKNFTNESLWNIILTENSELIKIVFIFLNIESIATKCRKFSMIKKNVFEIDCLDSNEEIVSDIERRMNHFNYYLDWWEEEPIKLNSQFDEETFEEIDLLTLQAELNWDIIN